MASTICGAAPAQLSLAKIMGRALVAPAEHRKRSAVRCLAGAGKSGPPACLGGDDVSGERASSHQAFAYGRAIRWRFRFESGNHRLVSEPGSQAGRGEAKLPDF